MKRLLALLGLACALVSAQTITTTPNVGLQVPAYGTQNWGSPLNYDLGVLDQMLGGAIPIPALNITGNIAAANLVTVGSYQGPWSSATSYSKGQTVLYNSAVYVSTVNSNVNNTPGSGGSWSLYLPVTNGGVVPVDMIASFVGQPGPGATVFVMTANRATTVNANFSGSNVTCGTNPAASAVYTALKNGASVGTITLSTSCTLTGSTTGSAAIALAAGDRFAITAPATQDVAAADVALSVAATR